MMGTQRLQFSELKNLSVEQVRQAIRAGAYQGHTAGLGKGYLQVNIVILPVEYALAFARFCTDNRKACPLISISAVGDPIMSTLGATIDIRTDVPAYHIYEKGQLIETRQAISELWSNEWVVFALGCSFTFEHALQENGISLWHIDQDLTVPMFKTNRPTIAAEPFAGNMVVSMRMIPKAQLPTVIDICQRYPMAHGKPIHWGDPEALGISDIHQPDWGDAVPVSNDRMPVFWACGVTPQVALMQAKLPRCITHKPGHMLITDIAEDADILQ